AGEVISNAFLPKVLTECPYHVPYVAVANVFAWVSTVIARFPVVFNRCPDSSQRLCTGHSTKRVPICVSRHMGYAIRPAWQHTTLSSLILKNRPTHPTFPALSGRLKATLTVPTLRLAVSPESMARRRSTRLPGISSHESRVVISVL